MEIVLEGIRSCIIIVTVSALYSSCDQSVSFDCFICLHHYSGIVLGIPRGAEEQFRYSMTIKLGIVPTN